MLKRKLQVSSSTLTPENSAGDKWPQQSHPAEDGRGCAGPAGADDAARTQFTACRKDLLIHPLNLESFLFFSLLLYDSKTYMYIKPL